MGPGRKPETIAKKPADRLSLVKPESSPPLSARGGTGRRPGAVERATRWLREGVYDAPLEPILHASPRRLKLLGAFTLIGHPLFFWIWHHAFPQPYDHLGVRVATALLGLPLLFDTLALNPSGVLTRRVFSLAAFVQLPLLFSWMYAMNGHNGVWLASLSGAILIYFHLTDWRIAAGGSLLGCLLGQAAAADHLPPAEHTVVLVFGWVAGLLLGLSGANLRRERLTHTLATIGIMAHELRTPLATTTLVADALLLEARRPAPGPRPHQLEKLGDRLHVLARAMNHHIDMEIANARLLHLPRQLDEVISARQLVQDVVEAYPFRGSHERQCVQIQVHADFHFRGSRRQFHQVLDNLIENAIRSLLIGSSILRAGDLRIEVGLRGERGVLAVIDQGVGMDAATQTKAFEPFFSTDQGIGHGLGLAFCRTVVQAAGGTIQVRSRPAAGAAFVLSLPLARPQARPATTPASPATAPDAGATPR